MRCEREGSNWRSRKKLNFLSSIGLLMDLHISLEFSLFPLVLSVTKQVIGNGENLISFNTHFDRYSNNYGVLGFWGDRKSVV